MKKQFVSGIILSILSIVVYADVPVVDAYQQQAQLNQQAATSPEAQQPATPASALSSGPIHQDQYQSYVSASDSDSADADNAATAATNSDVEVNNGVALLNRIASLEGALRNLQGRLDAEDHLIQRLQDQQKLFYSDLDSRITQLQNRPSMTVAAPHAALPVVAQHSSKPPQLDSDFTEQDTTDRSTSTAASDQAENASYEVAIQSLRNRDFSGAQKAFANYLHMYPQGRYESNVYYWQGELALQQKDYPRAITEFQTVVNRFPNSQKMAGSLLKLGFIYGDTGVREKAQSYLTRVTMNYPNTPEAQLAKNRLSELNG